MRISDWSSDVCSSDLLVGVKIDTGREITLLTNDLKAPAAEIAALYKARRQVELLFKWLKQNLKLTHFLGASENAVIIQIMAALIAYLLIRQIGRTPCREWGGQYVEVSVVGGSLKKKTRKNIGKCGIQM